MIRMVSEINHPRGLPDLHCPQTFCDWCDERIGDAADGHFHWRLDARGQPIEGAIYHVHKRCNRALEASMPGRWLWMPLTILPVQIAANLEIDLTAAAKTARLLSSF